jgi:hypothetical protein
VGFKIRKVTWLVKYADYQAKGFGVDTQKVLAGGRIRLLIADAPSAALQKSLCGSAQR